MPFLRVVVSAVVGSARTQPVLGAARLASAPAQQQPSPTGGDSWADDFVTMLEKGSGKTLRDERRQAEEAMEAKRSDPSEDLLTAALSEGGMGEMEIESSKPKQDQAKVLAFGSTSSAAVTHTSARDRRRMEMVGDPKEELMAEINKIRDRMSILPIKSAGALFGPGEGVMKIYEELKSTSDKHTETTKVEKERRKMVLKQGVPDSRIPERLLTAEATAERERELSRV
eukprot:TRINITY_DN8926_c0_g7_i1.p1 TRINITY_DN8926_c0_g7~~TRINITY_DN8926_c0_g7_i1.p1  ORF type:complete len:228 (+),score=56.84 TRINITY_DN8926_c0_g7_i1:51-734(+)